MTDSMNKTTYKLPLGDKSASQNRQIHYRQHDVNDENSDIPLRPPRNGSRENPQQVTRGISGSQPGTRLTQREANNAWTDTISNVQ